MAEYIKREAAIKAIEKADYTLIANDADSCESDYLREIIESVPATDVVPVVHGKWIKRGYVCGDYEWECSACHETEWRGLSGADVMRFCMFCGARMDGGADND
jgi:hypothetical protein|nr:MAG TPA: hypothetical protein [Caudoviricetes sp.]